MPRISYSRQHHDHFARFIASDGLGIWPSGGSIALGVAGRVFMSPLYVPWSCTIDRLGYVVGTTASGNIRMGLYPLGSSGYPDIPDGANLLVESASLAQPGTSRIHIVTVNDTSLGPGIYFAALQTDDITATAMQQTTACRLHHNVDGVVAIHRLFDNLGGYGAFADPCPVTTDGGATRYFWMLMRVKSNP